MDILIASTIFEICIVFESERSSRAGACHRLVYPSDRREHVLALRDSQRPLTETTGLVAADLVRFVLL